MLKSSTKISDSRLRNHKFCIPKCGTGMKLWVLSPNIGARLSGFIGVSLLVWWQFLRRSLAGGSGLEQEGASWGSGFSTKIHQEVVPRCPVTSLPCPR